MRSILIILLIAVYLIVTLPVLLILWLIRRKDEKKAERGTHRFISWILRAIAALAGVKLTVKGLENVPDEPVLYFSNHRSFFDVVLTYPLCSLPTSYVAKEDLKHIPLFGVWGTLMRCLFFDRSNARASVKMILDGVSYLKDDTSVYIFPEGTRNKNAQQTPLLEFHDGSFKMASRSGRAMLPVAIDGSVDIWEAHMPWVHKTAVTITYGRPVYFRDLSPEDQKHIGAYMKQTLEEMLA